MDQPVVLTECNTVDMEILVLQTFHNFLCKHIFIVYIVYPWKVFDRIKSLCSQV